jgi:hypothetical protein
MEALELGAGMGLKLRMKLAALCGPATLYRETA